jgi:hypothetical protein
MSWRLIGLIAAISTAGVWLLWGRDIALGVTGEWVWPRIPFSAETVTGWVTALVGGSLYLGYVLAAAARVATCGRVGLSSRLIGLALAGAAWLMCLMSSVPGIAGLSRSPFVLYYERSSGYFWQARYEVQSTSAFLAGYEDFVAQGDYLHQGTHPPGLILFFRGLLAFGEASSGVTDVLIAAEPESVRNAAETIRAQSLGTGHPFSHVDEACLWLATLTAILLAALGVVPLYGLLRENCDRRLSWHCAALWPLVPALGVFLPKSDAVFATLGLLGVWLWRVGRRRDNWWACVAAGFVLWLGMSLSLALAPIAVFAAIWTALDEVYAPRTGATRTPWRSTAGHVISAAAGFFVPILLVWTVFDLNLLAVWSWNTHNHAEFYQHFERTWWKWLLVNPLEAAFAAGLPLGVTALIGVLRSPNLRDRACVLALTLTWGVLWLSGKNMGEVARLWIVFLPWLVIATAAAFDPSSPGESRSEPRYAIIGLIVLQLVSAAMTATRVDGFQFDEVRGNASVTAVRHESPKRRQGRPSPSDGTCCVRPMIMFERLVWRLGYAVPTTRLRRMPSQSTSSSTMSPGLSQRLSSKPQPPGTVPEPMKSPG